MINDSIAKLIEHKDLDFTQTKEVFDEILSGLALNINSSAFLTALCAKNPTQDELSAAIIASNETIKKHKYMTI